MSDKLNETFQKHLGYLKTKLNGSQLHEIDFARPFKPQGKKAPAIIIKADGNQTNVEPENGTDFSTQEINTIVGGHFEVVYLHGSKETLLMLINEEGKLKNLPINKKATVLFMRSSGVPDTIHGDVLICHQDQVK